MFVAKKKKTKASLRSAKKEKRLPKIGTFTGMDPAMSEQMRETNRRMIRKRKRHNLRKRNKRKHRKKRHMKRRQRRRQKHRRRYRKMRVQVKRAAMTIDQKERLRSLKKRRDEKQKLANRLKRNEKIGTILWNWNKLRNIFTMKRRDKVLRRLLLKEKQEMKIKKTKEPKSKEKIVRSGRRKSKNKS
ncbi:hypothetical protein CAEBREN_29199 [Caenorhabditis brenneri]|uniref:Uncharacterized protein n=1 Tax=Caenorhabditis brenneri TaxID=135651 RepID=G0PDL9_CAEBE|nr:hypothetical protein CAEBREN_29199 [Caenorhabditis brenneri]